ncbi:MAG TPA: TCP-1/cpn60 chaperonin family protein, partial [Nitrososphaeraceae archaeon]|nr:TCP-1/cpn60 chaperonin family protein [Nitrososphaeraceae archaeon]
MSKVLQGIMKPTEQLFGQGVRRSKDKDTRRYNLLAARLIADLIKNSLGPCGMEKMFIDVLGEVTVTKDGATLLRKLDIEHPAAKALIEASNAVDNEVGDGTTSVVVLAGALIEKAEELLDRGISPSIIADGYLKGLKISLKTLEDIARISKNSDREIMERLATTSLR